MYKVDTLYNAAENLLAAMQDYYTHVAHKPKAEDFRTERGIDWPAHREATAKWETKYSYKDAYETKCSDTFYTCCECVNADPQAVLSFVKSVNHYQDRNGWNCRAGVYWDDTEAAAFRRTVDKHDPPRYVSERAWDAMTDGCGYWAEMAYFKHNGA